MIRIRHLFIYPVKSCAAQEVQALSFDDYGPVGDRRYMLTDEQGQFLTQRTLPRMACIVPQLLSGGLLLTAEGMSPLMVADRDIQGISNVRVWRDEVQAGDCGDEAAGWFSCFLGRSCRLVKLLPQTRRQIDPDYAGHGEWVSFADGFPLLITSESSLNALTAEAGHALDMLRFRPNIVVDGNEPFAELGWRRLLHESGELLTCKPCERCVIPTRNPQTQEREPEVLNALKTLCRIDGKIIFGQNALNRGIRQLQTGDPLRPCSE